MAFNVIASCRLTKDPTFKKFDNGAILNLDVASSRQVKDGDEWKEHPEYLKAVIRRGAEKLSDVLKKGDQLFITRGDIRTRSYEDEEGNTHYITELHIHEFDFGQKGKGHAENTASQAKPSSKPSEDFPADAGDEEDDLPF